MAVKSEQV